jgi:hypothetical protein
VHNEPHASKPQRRRRRVSFARFVLGLLLCWIIAAYVLVPMFWKGYSKHRATFDDNPRITSTADGIPGDPLNVAVIGTEAQLEGIMTAAGWYRAAALGLKSDLKIAADTVLSRPDDQAPVSSLYLFGRKEDIAFEQPVGDNPRHRHHVRFWKTASANADGRPEWIGSAVYDERVGLCRTTGQITHVTAVNVDAERDYLIECLDKTGDLADRYYVDGFHTQLEGRNGGGDAWRTDGRLAVGVIAADVRAP